MISYAQNFEDVMLRRVFRDRKDGFYIDIGAMDPVVESVTKFFYDEGWSGINIEPNEWFHRRLMQERPRDINLNLAVGERGEVRPLHVFQQYGISTFEQSNRDHFVNLGYEAKQQTATITTLGEVCRDYVKRQVDFLKVDCEGWEEFALKGGDWDRFRPIVVIVEATAPGTTTPSWSQWEPFLIETAHYEMVYFDGLNRFYLRREYQDLRSHFEVPPNIFDEFQVYATVKAEQAAQALQQERDSIAARLAQLEEKLNTTSAEHLQVSESLRAREAEIRSARGFLEAAEQERDNLVCRLAELEPQAARDHERIEQLEKECGELQEMLLRARLWVGRLSQDVAASKRQR
jgi:FkbM family methyltransferase